MAGRRVHPHQEILEILEDVTELVSQLKPPARIVDQVFVALWQARTTPIELRDVEQAVLDLQEAMGLTAAVNPLDDAYRVVFEIAVQMVTKREHILHIPIAQPRGQNH